jgi:hypothetical protein
MPLTRSGNHYTLRAKRLCPQCHEMTDQTATSCRYDSSEIPKVPPILIKRIEWLCDWCGSYEEEVKETLKPTDRTMILKRLLSLPEEYDVLGFTLSSEANVISMKIRLPDFDMSELRAIQDKQKETGFITVEELIKVQRAGYRQPVAVPPKPQPRDVAMLQKKERQRAFAGEPRPWH